MVSNINTTKSTISSAHFISLLLVGISIVLALIISSLIYRSVINPLSRSIHVAKRIAAFDLTNDGSDGVALEGNDEISMLSIDLVAMRESLHWYPRTSMQLVTFRLVSLKEKMVSRLF